jgi:hypothetical protein
MAEDRNYTITLKIEGSTNAGASSAVAGSSTQSQKQAVTSSENTIKPGLLQSAESRAAFTSSLVAWHTIKPFITQQINYQVSTVELRTGSKEMQAKANLQNEILQKGMGIIETATVGAMIGGLPGALIGLTLGTAQTFISYSQRQNTLNLQESLENRSIEMMRIRAGSLGSRSNYQ